MKTAVVLLNWNSAELTRQCVESLRRGTILPEWIYVLDNGSTDDSVRTIEGTCPGVLLRTQRENVGFSEGNNVCVREILRTDAELVWILNNDTVVDRCCLERLVEALTRNASADGVSAKILYADPPDRLWYAGGELRPWTMTARHVGIGQADRGQYNRERTVDFLSGCCMLLRRSALERVGLFHPAYCAYYEDVEWCLRARRHGIMFRYIPGAVMHHHVSAVVRRNTQGEGGRISPRAHYLMARNRLFTIRLHAEGPAQRVVASGAVLCNTVWLAVGFLVRRRWAKMRMLACGIRDGITTSLSEGGSCSRDIS